MAVIDGILKTNSSTLAQTPYYFRGASYIIDATRNGTSGRFDIALPTGFSRETTCIFYIRMPNSEVTYPSNQSLLFYDTTTIKNTLNVKSLKLGSWTNVSTHYYNKDGKYKFTDAGVIIPVYYYSNSFRVLGNPLLSSGTSSDGTAYYSIYADGLIEQWGTYISTSYIGAGLTVDFPIKMSNTSYIFEKTDVDISFSTSTNETAYEIWEKRNDSLYYKQQNRDTPKYKIMDWEVIGY